MLRPRPPHAVWALGSKERSPICAKPAGSLPERRARPGSAGERLSPDHDQFFGGLRPSERAQVGAASVEAPRFGQGRRVVDGAQALGECRTRLEHPLAGAGHHRWVRDDLEPCPAQCERKGVPGEHDQVARWLEREPISAIDVVAGRSDIWRRDPDHPAGLQERVTGP